MSQDRKLADVPLPELLAVVDRFEARAPEVAAELAGLEKVRRLASTQATTQTYEIAVYDQLLAGAYADA